MTDNYEFRYQSPRQKAGIVAAKTLIFLSMLYPMYALGWGLDETTEDRIRSIAGVMFGFWVYANVLKVKVEIQEMYVPPFAFEHAREFLYFALFLYIGAHVWETGWFG